MSASRLLARSYRILVRGRRPLSSAPGVGVPPAAAAAAEPRLETVVGVRVDTGSLPESVANAMSLENASRAEVRRVRKMRLIEQFRRSESDTGSPEVQSAFATRRHWRGLAARRID